MGHRHDEPLEAAPRRRAPLSRAAVAACLVALLGAAWIAGGRVLVQQAAVRDGARVAELAGALDTILVSAGQELEREATLLAQERRTVEAVTNGDWEAVVRGASPRLQTTTRERLADLVVVLDATRAPLMQLPATPRLGAQALSPLVPGPATIRAIGGRPHLIALAPIRAALAEAHAQPIGLVLAARRLDSLQARVAAIPSMPGVVAVAGDAVVFASVPEAPASGWSTAIRAGRVRFGARTWAIAPTSMPNVLALIPIGPLGDREWTLAWLAGSFAVAAAAVMAGVGLGARGHLGAAPASPPRSEDEARVAAAADEAAARALLGDEDLAAMAEEAVELARGAAHLDAGALFCFHPPTRTLFLVAHRGLTYDAADRLRVLPLDESPPAEAYRTGRVIVTNVGGARTSVGALATVASEAGHRLHAALPIGVNGTPWGALLLAACEERQLDDRELKLLESVAHQIGLAVARAALVAESREKSRRLETLARLAQRLTATLSPAEVFQRVVDATVELFAGAQARLWLVEEEGLVLRATAGGGSIPAVATLVKGEGVIGAAVVGRAPIVLADALADPRTHVLEVDGAGRTALAVVPLVLAERVIGGLSLAALDRPAWSADDVALLQSLGDQAAIAIGNAGRFSTERADRAQLEALLEISKRIGARQPTEELLTWIAEEAARLLDVDNAGFRLLEGDDLVLAGLAGTARDTMTRKRIRNDESLSGLVMRKGRALIVNLEAMNEVVIPEHRDAERRLGYTTFLGVPLRVGSRTIGCFAFRARRLFTERDAELAQAFADQAGVALEHTRLYAETSERLEQTRALLDVAEILSSTLDSTPLLKRVAVKIAQVCRVDRCSIELWDGDRAQPLMSQFADGRPRPKMWRAFRGLPPYAPGDVPAHQQAIDTRRPIVIDDTAETDLIPRAWIDAFGLKSYVVVPLIRQGTVIGAMSLDYCERVTPFAAWQTELAVAIAGQLALALENARLYGEARERLRETTALLAVGQALARRAPLEEQLRAVAREVGRTFGADMVGVCVVDDARAALQPIAGYHVPAHLRETLRQPFVLARTPELFTDWREGRPVWSPDVSHDSRFDRETFEPLGPHAVLFAPTRVRGESVGAIFLVWWEPGRRFQPAEIRLLDGVAHQVALAMDNADLARQTESRLRQTETLLSITRALASTLDVPTLLRHFLSSVARALGAETVGAWLLDEDGETFVPHSAYHVPPEHLDALRRIRLSVREGLGAAAARTKQPILSEDFAADERIPEAIRAAVPVRSQVLVPIVTRERLIGAFTATWWSQSRRFTADEIALLDAMAAQAGVAVDNARLFEADRRQVEELSALHDLSRAVTGQLDRGALMDAVAQCVRQILGVDTMTLLLVDEPSGEFRVALRLRDAVRDDTPPHSYDAATGLMAVVRRQRRAIRTTDYVAECARRGVAPETGVATMPHWLGAPLAVGDRALGVLAVSSMDRAFSAADERLLTNIGALVALALRSARLFEERTRALDDLAAAQDRLVRTEKLRALGEMASGVAHDFNNFLSAILGRAQLLMTRVKEPTLKQWLQVIERSAQDGAQAVRRLQEFTRIRRDAPLVDVDLNEVVRDALDITQSRWRDDALRRGVSLEVQSSLSPVPAVAGDAGGLREAMTNLILNAIDAMPAGGQLTLTTGLVDGEVEVTVADTGVGMSEEVKRRLFEPFFTTKGPQGTGLGLSMTYGILSRHGARVTVDSEEGRGSTFRLLFTPRVSGPAAPEARPTATVSIEPRRCLVVDDEETVGQVIGDILETAGHAVVVLTDGRAAVERVQAETFDVVFTDLAMPGISGWDVARAVKAATPQATVFLVSGFGAELSPQECQSDVDGILAKPLKIEQILDVVTRAGKARA